MPKNVDLQALKVRIPQGGVTVRGTTATSTPWFLSLYVLAFVDTELCSAAGAGRNVGGCCPEAGTVGGCPDLLLQDDGYT